MHAGDNWHYTLCFALICRLANPISLPVSISPEKPWLAVGGGRAVAAGRSRTMIPESTQAMKLGLSQEPTPAKAKMVNDPAQALLLFTGLPRRRKRALAGMH